MKLRTSLPARDYPFDLSYQSRILSLGSCFADHIGQRLEKHLFNIQINPFGIVYHPLALARSLNRLIAPAAYTEDELIFHNDLYHSLDHHGKFSGPDADKVLFAINKELTRGSTQLAKADLLFITLGTSWGYFHWETKNWAANCHKIPQTAFEKKLTGVEKMIPIWKKLITEIFKINPSVHLVFTVSPVRHLKDGLENNTKSKAHLHLLIDQLQNAFQSVHYFPAYELMMDDLRDYRFYATDLLHPNQLAQDYIWKYFQQVFFQQLTLDQYTAIEQLVQAAAHRPFHPALPAHQKFVAAQLLKLKALSQNNPNLNFSSLKDGFEQQLLKQVD